MTINKSEVVLGEGCGAVLNWRIQSEHCFYTDSHLSSSLAMKMKPLPSKARTVKNRDKRSNEAVADFCKCRPTKTDWNDLLQHLQ